MVSPWGRDVGQFLSMELFRELIAVLLLKGPAIAFIPKSLNG